jgi:hypothetical protein
MEGRDQEGKGRGGVLTDFGIIRIGRVGRGGWDQMGGAARGDAYFVRGSVGKLVS